VIVNIPVGILKKYPNYKFVTGQTDHLLQPNSEYCSQKFYHSKKRPFWKDKCTGDGLYSEDYHISMSHDMSPINGECGILVFFHCGAKYDKWHQQFPLNMENRTETIRRYYKTVLARMYLNGNEESPELSEIIYLNVDIMQNRFIHSAFQSNCKPGTLTALLRIGEVFQKYY